MSESKLTNSHVVQANFFLPALAAIDQKFYNVGVGENWLALIYSRKFFSWEICQVRDFWSFSQAKEGRFHNVWVGRWKLALTYSLSELIWSTQRFHNVGVGHSKACISDYTPDRTWSDMIFVIRGPPPMFWGPMFKIYLGRGTTPFRKKIF